MVENALFITFGITLISYSGSAAFLLLNLVLKLSEGSSRSNFATTTQDEPELHAIETTFMFD